MYHFFKILLGWALILLYTHAFPQSVNCAQMKSIVSDFVNTKYPEKWNIIEIKASGIQKNKCKCDIAPVIYYISRMHVFFPNSHTLKGITPDDFVANHQSKMIEQIKILKNCKEKSYWPLINAMKEQDFDEQISNTMEELSKELLKNKG